MLKHNKIRKFKDFKSSVNFQPGDDMVTYPFDLMYGSIGSVSAVYIADYLNLRISENDPVFRFVPQVVLTVTDSVGFAHLIIEGKHYTVIYRWQISKFRLPNMKFYGVAIHNLDIPAKLTTSFLLKLTT